MSKLLESGENYLETILILTQKGKGVRSVDVATEMSFSKASVSRAVSNLKKGGYLIVDECGNLILTDSGYEVADKIYERHRVLTRFLMKLGVNEKTAAEDACKIEHDISNESFAKLKIHLRRMIEKDNK